MTETFKKASDQELVSYVFRTEEGRTDLEIELAKRLEKRQRMIGSFIKELDGLTDGKHSGRKD